MGFCISRHSECPRPRWGFHFWIKKRQTPVGFYTSRHSECPRPQWGFHFLDKKTTDPGGVLHFPTPWKSKTHPVSSNFLTKKYQLHPVVCYLRHSESQNYTLYLLFFNKKMPTTPCSLLSRTLWKSKPHPVASYFSHPECLILKNSGCLILMDITKTYRGLKKNCVFLSLS